MKNQNCFKIFTTKAVVVVLIFTVFYLTAREDRVFKNWREENKLLFISYTDIKSRFQHRASPGDKLLIDGTVLQNLHDPFQENLLGNYRKPLYFFLSSRLKTYSISLKTPEFHLHVKKLTPMRGIELYNSISMSFLKTLHPENFQAIKEFMLKNEIKYFVCPYQDWWAKKKKLKKVGLKLIIGNKCFILSKIK